MSIDLDALEARLREYDPDAPKCPRKVEELVRDRPDYAADDEEHYTIRLQHPCCRPEGHEGECRNRRRVLGWPGYRVLVELVAEVRRLRALESAL
jgi:hypothetical protein